MSEELAANHPFGGNTPRVLSAAAIATLAAFRAALPVTTPPTGGVIVVFESRSPQATSFTVDADFLRCREAALLASTCKFLHKDLTLKERFTPEAKEFEKGKDEERALVLLHCLIAISSPEDDELDFDIDEDGHWVERGLGGYESYGQY